MSLIVVIYRSTGKGLPIEERDKGKYYTTEENVSIPCNWWKGRVGSGVSGELPFRPSQSCAGLGWVITDTESSGRQPCHMPTGQHSTTFYCFLCVLTSFLLPFLSYSLKLREGDIDVLFRDEHSLDIYSHNFDELQASVVITIQNKERISH